LVPLLVVEEGEMLGLVAEGLLRLVTRNDEPGFHRYC
jgi:hypothetical protein